MAMIEDAIILFKNIDESFIKHYFGVTQLKNDKVYTITKYKCSIYTLNDDCIRDSLDLAVDINNEWIFDAYGENELTFEFIEDMLKNTNGDFMFLDDYEIVFERRNGLLIAVDSNDHFHTCSFKNCYELLKSKHINGKHDDYDFEIVYDGEISTLKDIIIELGYKSKKSKEKIKIIEYNEISERFAVLFDYFSVTVGSSEGKNNTFDISIHFTYSGDLNDKREEYLNRFISYIFERFNVPEKYTYIIEKLIEKHF
ncbi:MAG: hypothetical protein PUB89_05470 [Oscillospiraceae bacterium]|nr:hypothetical protein [Oscillospiraceae bacterium]MDO5151219.1 hypothetical protein [Oscillospiraceae bacterium]